MIIILKHEYKFFLKKCQIVAVFRYDTCNYFE